MSTPLMRQYHEIKQQFADALLLFQVGDFYELFFEDAQKAAAFLGIALTKRGYHNGEPIPLCGVPVHTKDHYITKLVRGGFKIALVDQLTQAVPGKMVERGVTSVLTPGTLTDTHLLSQKSASYLAALYSMQGSVACVFIELLTSDVWLTVIPYDIKTIEAELARFSPDEIICSPHETAALRDHLTRLGYWITNVEVSQQTSLTWLEHAESSVQQFITQSRPAQQALLMVQNYLQKTQHVLSADHITMHWYCGEDFLIIDTATHRNLELTKNLFDGTQENTLFSVLDGAVTSMGSRLIKKWLSRPLNRVESINARLDTVEFFVNQSNDREKVRTLLQICGDLERVIGRIALKRAMVQDYRHLVSALHAIASIKALIDVKTPLLIQLHNSLHTLPELCQHLQAALYLEGVNNWIIAAGYHQDLDRLRTVAAQGTQHLLVFEQEEIARTGINSLKIRHNQSHGYAIEITKANNHLVPQDYQLLQSLVNKDRYTSDALKVLEYDIVHAHEQIAALEQQLFSEVQGRVFAQSSLLRKTAHALAQLDALVGFAHVAYTENYVKPTMTQERNLEIIQGKHPVLAGILKHSYIPNSVLLTTQEPLWVITGPNMGGKSTFLRQTALLSIMAHVGSFVPAHRAIIPLFDRIFTRIGAADYVAQGKSTFFVEMEESAHICNQATQKSLVIFDELGRGTSTYDGLAIAQAILESMYTSTKALCLCATHYHELAELAARYSGIKLYHAAVNQTAQGVVLLHRIMPGIAQGSFGIQVARDAHIPPTIIERAEQLLLHFQNDVRKPISQAVQAPITEHPLVKQIKNIDYDSLSPKQAFDIMWNLKEMV